MTPVIGDLEARTDAGGDETAPPAGPRRLRLQGGAVPGDLGIDARVRARVRPLSRRRDRPPRPSRVDDAGRLPADRSGARDRTAASALRPDRRRSNAAPRSP